MYNLVSLGFTKNQCEVFVDFKHSHAATHFKESPRLKESVIKAIPILELTEDKHNFEIDTGEIVGKTDLVETGPTDEIVYVLRKNREIFSRFVKNRVAIPSSWIVIRLYKIVDQKYLLYTAYVGRLTPSFPGGDYLPNQSLEFWSRHALVWGNQEIVNGTDTKECPW